MEIARFLGRYRQLLLGHHPLSRILRFVVEREEEILSLYPVLHACHTLAVQSLSLLWIDRISTPPFQEREAADSFQYPSGTTHQLVIERGWLRVSAFLHCGYAGSPCSQDPFPYHPFPVDSVIRFATHMWKPLLVHIMFFLPLISAVFRQTERMEHFCPKV